MYIFYCVRILCAYLLFYLTALVGGKLSTLALIDETDWKYK